MWYSTIGCSLRLADVRVDQMDNDGKPYWWAYGLDKNEAENLGLKWFDKKGGRAIIHDPDVAQNVGDQAWRSMRLQGIQGGTMAPQVAPSPVTQPKPATNQQQAITAPNGVRVEAAQNGNKPYWWIYGIDEKAATAAGAKWFDNKRRALTYDPLTAARFSGMPSEQERVLYADSTLSVVDTGFKNPANGQAIIEARAKGKAYDLRHILAVCGFTFGGKNWTTTNPDNAQVLIEAAQDPSHPKWTEAAARDEAKTVERESHYFLDHFSQEAYDNSSATTRSDIPIPVPPGENYLDFQTRGVEFVNVNTHGLIGDPPGLGKTQQTIGAINSDPSIKTALIVTTKNTKLGWVERLNKWLMGPHLRDDQGNLKVSVGYAKGDFFPSTDIVVINYDLLKRHAAALQSRQWDLAVVDEVHKMKNVKTGWAKTVIGEFERGEKISNGIPAKRRIALTGTPQPNRVEELWPILHYVHPDLFPTFAKFRDSFCKTQEVRRTIKKRNPETGKLEEKDVKVQVIVGSKNEELLNKLLRGGGTFKNDDGDMMRVPPIMMRRPEDVVDIPDKDRQTVMMEVDDDQLHDKLVAESDKILNGEAFGKLEQLNYAISHTADANNVQAFEQQFDKEAKLKFEQYAPYRQLLGKAKAPLAAEHALEIVERDLYAGRPDKVIVFAWHRDVVDEVASIIRSTFASWADEQARETGEPATPLKVQVIHGGTNEDRSAAAMASMQTDPDTRVLVASIGALKEGVTITEANHVVYAEFSWVPSDQDQSEKRSHRIGQDRKVQIDYIIIPGTLDEYFLNTLGRKQKNISQILDPITAPQGAQDKVMQAVNNLAKRLRTATLK